MHFNMDKLENLLKYFAKKYPITTTFVGFKVIDSTLLGLAYTIWPEETLQVINNSYQIGKESMPFVSMGATVVSNELIYAASNLRTLATYVLDKVVRTV